jgi:DNA-binding response OmpR family regulator
MENLHYFSETYPLSILIAEPNHDTRLSAKDVLTQLGYRPEVVTTGQDLLRLTSNHSYDVVLMDIGIPEAEGILASQLGDTHTRRPILIAMTAAGQTDFREMYLRDGMDHSITKPFDLDELSLQLKACSLLTGTRRIRSDN